MPNKQVEVTKTAVVTGGTRGIGAAISQSLKAAGYQVIALYASNATGAKKFEKDNGIYVVQCDVADYAQCQEVVKTIQAEHGTVSILVNNAGITRDGFLHKMHADDWMSVIETNLGSCFNMCRATIPQMREKGFGRIINISSINAQKGQLGQTNYAAAKAGMIGFTKALALESANKGITVNAVSPGYIATEMTGAMKPEVLQQITGLIPVGRLGTPEEIATLVTYLVSPQASFITGATLSINGGQLMD